MIHQPTQMNSSVKSTRCTLSSCYRKNSLEKISPRNKNAAQCGSFWRGRQQIHLTNIFHVFRKSTSAEMKKDKNLLTSFIFYDFKRSESEMRRSQSEAKNQTQSDVPLCRTGSRMKLKNAIEIPKRNDNCFLLLSLTGRQASDKQESAQRRGWWKFKNVIKRNFYDEISRSEKSLKFPSILKNPKILFSSSSVTNWNAWSALFVIILYLRLIKIPFQ